MTELELYRCERCGSIYDEVEIEDMGNQPQCGCGYRFGRDLWQLETKVKVRALHITAVIQSEYLEQDWSEGEGYYYLTSIYSEEREFIDVWKHKTREEARQTHRKVEKALYMGKVTDLGDEIAVNLGE
jgi:hypothetical protein